MSLLTVLLSIILVLNAAFLMLLVLIQLPKKEAGAGLAFGAGATDALFGAGSGTVLTKITKYAAGIFFALAIILSLLRNSYYSRNVSRFQQNFGQTPTAPAGAASRPSAPAPALPPALPTTNALTTNATLQSAPAESTNVLAPASTNAPK